MSVFVYAIKSTAGGRIYVGQTQNIEKRLNEHNLGRTKSTKAYRPWKIIYFEELDNRVAAREREK